jgi:purine-binding chemotaxis protein CheW
MLHVLFQVGDAEYVLAAADVVQMESFSGATRVPGAAPHVAGLVQVRGRVVPVVDARARFGLPHADPTLDTRVVVVRDGAREVGLLVDRAREVLHLDPKQFQPPPPVVAESSRGFVRSVAQAEKRLLMLIDLGKVIGHEPLTEEGSHGQEAQAPR